MVSQTVHHKKFYSLVLDLMIFRRRGYLRNLTHGDSPASRMDANLVTYDRRQDAIKSLGFVMR